MKNKKGEIISVEGDYCLVAVEGKAYTEKLGLDKIGVETDKAGRVITNDHLETSVKNIYAIGDVVKGAMFSTQS